MSTEETVVETNPLSDRLRSSLALVPVPAQLRQVPEQLRQVPGQLRNRVKDLVHAAGSRLRATLDLPSGAELQELLARVEELDRRLDSLQVAEPAAKTTVTAKPAAKTKAPAKKSARSNGAGTKSRAKKAEKAAPKKARVKKIAERAGKAKKSTKSKR